MSTAESDLPDVSGKTREAPLRFVTAASLFDGHDAAINIMRRLIQARGAEVIHLGHNRSVDDIVRAAIQEDADAIAISSYQGGHNEFFRYMIDRLREADAGHIKVFGGGGGTITPEEIHSLMDYGVERIYHPHDGMALGLEAMIEDAGQVPVIGVTGTGGAGKSSVTDEILNRFLACFPDKRVAVLAVDPTRRRTGGALLGDRIRMNSLRSERVYMRSIATRRQHLATSEMLSDHILFLKSLGFDMVIVETAGIGQSDSEIVDMVDFSVYVMTGEYGAASQLEKIDMLDFADLIILNKYDKRGAEDALRDIPLLLTSRTTTYRYFQPSPVNSTTRASAGCSKSCVAASWTRRGSMRRSGRLRSIRIIKNRDQPQRFQVQEFAISRKSQSMGELRTKRLILRQRSPVVRNTFSSH